MKEAKGKKALTLKTLNKSNVWDLQENDVFRLWQAVEKDADLKDNLNHYTDVIRSAFNLEEVKVDKPEVIKKYEARGYKVGTIRIDDSTKLKWAIMKKPINRITDLSYENIRHISAAQLIEVLSRNFGGGWDSIPQSIQDIIQSGFDVSSTTLPANRLHKEGGMYEKRVKDGYEVLEIPQGTWTEAIFVKEKPQQVKPRYKSEMDEELEKKHRRQEVDDDEDEDEEEEKTEESDDADNYNDEEVEPDDDELAEESYRTDFEENDQDLNLEAEDVIGEDGDY